VFGCLGATHIAINAPGKTMSKLYRNEKNYTSYHCQFVTGVNLEFYDIMSYPGSFNEKKIYNLSTFKKYYEINNYKGILLSTSNYININDKYIMTVIHCAKNYNEKLYNEAFKKTINITKTMNMLKRRFKCLQTIINNKENIIELIINSCAILHNLTRKHHLPLPEGEENSLIKDYHSNTRFTQAASAHDSLNDVIGDTHLNNNHNSHHHHHHHNFVDENHVTSNDAVNNDRTLFIKKYFN